MPRIHIEVSGPGGCISSEVEHIRKMFEPYFKNITVYDAHVPHDGVREMTPLGETWELTIKADHQPWGG